MNGLYSIDNWHRTGCDNMPHQQFIQYNIVVVYLISFALLLITATKNITGEVLPPRHIFELSLV
jgi:hypothetical protein